MRREQMCRGKKKQESGDFPVPSKPRLNSVGVLGILMINIPLLN